MGDKITNANIKLFANAAGPTGVIGIFGTNKAGSPTYSSDPDLIQGFTGATGRTGLTGQNAWTQGWNAAVNSSLVPTIQDMNAYFYVMTRHLAYLNQVGIQRWLSTVTYADGSYVTDSDGTVYQSKSGVGNLNKAVSNPDYWQVLWSNKVTRIGDNYTVAYNDKFIIWSEATPTVGHSTITLPAYYSGQAGRQIIIGVSSDTTSTQITCGSDTIYKSQWRRYTATGSSATPWLSSFLN